MKWRLVNNFVELARDNDKLPLIVKVFHQNRWVLLETERRHGGRIFRLNKLVGFTEIRSTRNLHALVDNVCEAMREEIAHVRIVEKLHHDETLDHRKIYA